MIRTNLQWRLRIGTPPGEVRLLHPEEMREFTSFAEGNTDHFVWRGHPEYGSDFEVEITLTHRPDGLYAARLQYRHYKGKDHVEEIGFPCYHETVRPGTRFVCGGHALGDVMTLDFFREEMLNRANPYVCKNTAINLNLILRPDHTGLYMDFRDPENLCTDMTCAWMEENEIFCEMVQILPLSAVPSENYAMGFDSVIGEYAGDWFAGAQIYREWAVRQWWFAGRTKPNPLRKIACWLWNRGSAEHVVAPALHLQEDLGNAPLALDWYWWHSNPYDTDYPNYWPPREGEDVFRRGISRCREKGIFTQVYMNGVCWDMDTWNWSEGGREGAVVNRDGQEHAFVFNAYTGHRLAWECGEASVFQKKIREQTLLLHRAGLSGQYLDMIGTNTDPACYNPHHSHKPGGGTFFVDGFRKMLQDIHAENGPDFPLTTEEPNEKYMDLLDGGITLFTSCERLYQTPHKYSVPLFPAVYHGPNALAVFGNYALPDGIPPWDEKWPAADRWQTEEPWHKLYPYQFTVEFARCIVWGIQPMVCNFTEKIYTDPEFRNIYRFIVDGATFFHRERHYLFDGQMLDPEGFHTEEHEVAFLCRFIFTKRENVREVRRRLPKILHGVWQAPSGSKALFAVNYTDQTVSWQYGAQSGEMPPYSFRKIEVPAGKE